MQAESREFKKSAQVFRIPVAFAYVIVVRLVADFDALAVKVGAVTQCLGAAAAVGAAIYGTAVEPRSAPLLLPTLMFGVRVAGRLASGAPRESPPQLLVEETRGNSRRDVRSKASSR